LLADSDHAVMVAEVGVGAERADGVGHLLQSAERADDLGLEVIGPVSLVRPTRSCLTFSSRHPHVEDHRLVQGGWLGPFPARRRVVETAIEVNNPDHEIRSKRHE
jgi:hypothetical protein